MVLNESVKIAPPADTPLEQTVRLSLDIGMRMLTCGAGAGALLCLWERLLGRLHLARVFTTFLLSLLAGLCNVLLVKVGLGAHFDAICIGNIMLLIPGIAMTNAVHDMFVGDMISGISRFFQSLVIAFIVTFGFTVAGMWI